MSGPSLDLRIRIFSDGGFLFNHLIDIQNSSSRYSRAVQLMHLGLLVESGRIAINGSEPTAVAKRVHSVPIAASIEQKRELVTPDFDTDDLAATFGL